MKKKRLLVFAVVATTALAFLGASRADARSPQRYRWEGVAIGIGAALVGSALFHPPYYHRPAPMPFYPYPPPHQPECYRWEVRRIWIPAEYDRIWIPGHYGRKGCWIPGHWEKRMVHPGHWEERRYCVRER